MEILLYEMITSDSAKAFTTALHKASGEVTVAIHSGGGSVYSGYAMYAQLKKYNKRTTARIDGLAASMATVIALGAERVEMAHNGWWMMHNPSIGMSGEASDLRKSAEQLDKVRDQIAKIYAEKSNLPLEKINAMMDAETWLTAKEAKDLGFIDGIFQSELEFDMSAAGAELINEFKNAPLDIVLSATQASITNEENRQSKIKDLFSYFDQHDDVLNQCLNDKKISPTAARDLLLKAMANQAVPHGSGGLMQNNYGIYAGNGNLVGDSIRAELMSRAGHEQAEADNRYAGYSLKELARASLSDRGVTSSNMRHSMQMVGLAFTHSSSDFGSILMDVAHKSALKGWDDAPETYQHWTTKGTLSDFRTAHRVGLDSFPSLREVRPGAEYKYATIGDKGEAIALATYGELFSIDRQSIVNDDMSMITTIPERMGRAARRTIGDLVYAMLLDESHKMRDGMPTFCKGHHNYFNAQLTTISLSRAKEEMRLQSSDAGGFLNITPKFMIVPPGLESRAIQVLNSQLQPFTTTNCVNPFYKSLELLVEPRLYNSEFPHQWFLAASQGMDTLEVAYLDGIEAPYLEQQERFSVDGATFKVRIDAGVAPLDWRGMSRSLGSEWLPEDAPAQKE